MHPAESRDGYAVFVKCIGLDTTTPPDEFAATVNALDAILHKHIRQEDGDFFPNPFGGAIYCKEVFPALEAAGNLIQGLAKVGIPAAIGIAWGGFRRAFNVGAWNAASSALNKAARLAFSDAALGRVLVAPKVVEVAGDRVHFGPEREVEVKGSSYRYCPVESPEFTQSLAAKQAAESVPTQEAYIVLWDIVKYSKEHPDEQVQLEHKLAEQVTLSLQVHGLTGASYSPTGDGGFAVIPDRNQTFEFAKFLLKHSPSIPIRVGINHGVVAEAHRGWVGSAVLRTDYISARAEDGGIAIHKEVWDGLRQIAQSEWGAYELVPNILGLFPRGVVQRALISASRRFEQATIRTELDLLQANRRVTALLGRDADLESLRKWLKSRSAISVRTLIGKGGAGKTRLALEFLSEAEKDWHAGFLLSEDFERFHADPTFRQWRWDRPTLIALDYAGQVHEKLKEWLKVLAVIDATKLPPLRFLLLERDASLQTGWYQSLTSIRDSFTTSRTGEFFDPLEPVEITPLRGAEFRRAILRETLKAAEQHLKRPHLELPENDPAFENALAHQQWSEPLALMMAALYSVETGVTNALTLGRADLALKLAAREQNRIAGFAPGGAGRPMMVHLATCATLSGGFTKDEALKTAKRECEELGKPLPGPGDLVEHLADALPGLEGGIAAVTPDLIGEALLTLHLQAHGSSAFHRCLDFKPKPVIDAMVRTPQDFWREANTVTCLSEALAAGDAERKTAIWERLPELGKTTALRQVRLQAERVMDTLLLSDASPPEQRAERLINRAYALGEAGRIADAAAAEQEAVDIYRTLSLARPETFLSLLATSVNNLSSSLSALGRRDGALTAAEEAVNLRRQLAKANPDAFLPNLATSLINLVKALSEVGRHADALAAGQEAVDLYRALVKADPDTFLPDLATSVNNVAAILSEVRRHDDALAAAQEAVDLRRALAKANPDAFLPNLASSVNNLAKTLGQVGRSDDALIAAQEASELYRILAKADPDAFLPALAISVNTLAIVLSNVGRRNDALATAQEAVDLHRALANANPDTFLPELARSLTVLSNARLDADDPRGSLSSSAEALQLLAAPLDKFPDAFAGLARFCLRLYNGALKATGQAPDDWLQPTLGTINRVLKKIEERDAGPL